MLRIDQFGVSAMDSKESGIEKIRIVERRTRANVLGTGARRIIERIFNFARLEVTNRFGTFEYIRPERLHIWRAGKAAGHTDDRDLTARLYHP